MGPTGNISDIGTNRIQRLMDEVTPQILLRVDRLEDPDTFSYDEFFHRYMMANAPCLFSAEFSRSWSSRRSWVTSDNKPNWGHLLQVFGASRGRPPRVLGIVPSSALLRHFCLQQNNHSIMVSGDAVVPVANCDVKEYNANPKELLPLREYIAYWREYTENGRRSARGCLYLKDWHMRRAFPDQDVYDTPPYFSSDWLNEYWDAIAVDDYRFVYMGPAGSWTPFHADVFRSYSWSANICGRKKWLLFPPGQEELLRDCSGNLPYDVTAPSLQKSGPPPLEVIQEAGEIIFVPSGWYHQVYNLEDTISINHNWVNGCNVSVMWSFLQAELSAVQREIREWKETMDDWEQHCQIILKSCTGIDYKEFYTFLKIIAEHRIQALQGGDEDNTLQDPNIMAPGPRHVRFDLRKIADTLVLLMDNTDFQKLDTETLHPRPEDLLRDLESAMERLDCKDESVNKVLR